MVLIIAYMMKFSSGYIYDMLADDIRERVMKELEKGGKKI
jgi:hypothetical protein